MSRLAIVLALVLCLNLFGANVFAVGELDTTFNSTGRNYISFNQPNTFLQDIAVQPDGKIVVGQTLDNSFLISRLTDDSPMPFAADISGQIVNSQNRGVPNGRITLTDLQSGETKIIPTNPFGYFRFNRLPTDKVYQIKVSHKRYDFAESVQTFRLSGNLNGLVISGE